MKKLICLVMIWVLCLNFHAVYAGTLPAGDIPYVPYVYNEMFTPVGTPAAFVPEQLITGSNLGIGDFKDITDLFYAPDGKVYIADSGNHRVVVTDARFKQVKEISTFEHEGKKDGFKNPTGVYVTQDRIYVADSENARIVCFDKEFQNVEKIFPRPVIDMLGSDYAYAPQKVVVDFAGRMYVIARGINQGLLQLDADGSFMSFMGAPRVRASFADIFWKRLATAEQRKRMQRFVPTEYSSVSMDPKGFLFVTSSSTNVMPIGRLNSLGENILRVTGSNYPIGDKPLVSSTFADICLRGNGIYTVLDSTMGRVFSYDEDGNLLHVFGGAGGQRGTFRAPSAIEAIGDKIIVADQFTASIHVFQRTPFGQLIENAVDAHKKGLYDQAEKLWNEVMRQCSNYDMAYIGLARIDIQKERYGEALEKLGDIGEGYYYSKAFKEYRSDFIRKNFTILFAGAVLFILLLIFFSKIVKKTGLADAMDRYSMWKQIKYGGYVMLHPFDGFWDLKREKRGSLGSALVLFGGFALLYALRVQYSGYLFLQDRSENINVFFEVSKIMVPLLLWCAASWCFTTLMDGEGGLRDIFISVSYALTPYILLNIPMLILSHFLVWDERMFYYLLDSIAVGWVLGLLVIGMMMTHSYSMKKTLLTVLLTLVGMGLIIFIALLFFNLIQEVFTFGMNIYQELMFRTY